MLVLSGGGFAHLYLTLLMCRSQSVETIHSDHLSNEDDSVGIVFHKTKVGNGPKDRDIFTPILFPRGRAALQHLVRIGFAVHARTWSPLSAVAAAKSILEGICPRVGPA